MDPVHEVAPVIGLPPKIAAVYWTRWNPEIRLTQVPRSYNVLYLFAAGRSDGEEGEIEWGMDEIVDDINTVRSRGQRVVLSTGGAGQGIHFSSRDVSRRFVDSVERINTELGGSILRPAIDGVDFNTFEAELAPDTSEYLWMFRELKRRFGQDFAITSPPAPWNEQDRTMIREALSEDLMTYAGPQFYDGPGLSDPEYIIETTREWVQDVAGGDASKIVVGFGMEDAENYSSIRQIRSAWRVITTEFPSIRGVYLWQHRTDADRGWAFAAQVASRVVVAPAHVEFAPSTPPPRPVLPPGAVVRIGRASYPLAGVDIAVGPDVLVVYTDSTPPDSRRPYGCDVTVLDGRVLDVQDRRSSGSMSVAPVPPGGFVLSGYGDARMWLLAHARSGEAVTGIA